MTQPMQVVVGMRVRLRKTHPCGGDEWVVTRAGADVGLVCGRCARRVMLEREEFERRVRQIVSLPTDTSPLEALSSASTPDTPAPVPSTNTGGSLLEGSSLPGKPAE